jgi:hypothetical protein
MIDVRLFAKIESLAQYLNQTQLDGDVGICTLLNPRSATPHVPLTKPTYLNDLRRCSVNGNSYILTGLRGIRGDGERVYGDDVGGDS